MGGWRDRQSLLPLLHAHPRTALRPAGSWVMSIFWGELLSEMWV